MFKNRIKIFFLALLIFKLTNFSFSFSSNKNDITSKLFYKYEKILTIKNKKEQIKRLCKLINSSDKILFYPFVTLAGMLNSTKRSYKNSCYLQDKDKRKILNFILGRFSKNNFLPHDVFHKKKFQNPFLIYEYLIRGGTTEPLKSFNNREKRFFLAITKDKHIEYKDANKVYLKHRNSTDPEEKLFYTIFFIQILNNQYRDSKKIKEVYEYYVKTKNKWIRFDLAPLNFYFFTYYSIKGEFKKIVDILEKAKKFAAKYYQSYWYHFSNIKLIETYSELYEIEKSKALYFESENFLKNSSLKRLYGYLLSAISFYYEDFGLYEKAEEKLKKLVSLGREIAPLVYAFSLSQLSKIEYLLGKDKEAEFYAKKGLKESERIGLKLGINNSLQTLALLRIRQNKIKEGLELFNRIFELSKNEERVKPEIVRYFLYALIKAGEFKKAVLMEKTIKNYKIAKNYLYIIEYYFYLAKKKLLENTKLSFFKSPFIVFSYYKNISRAYDIVNEITIDNFKSKDEKLDYLKNKIDIYSSYAISTKKLAIEIVKLFLFLIIILFIFTSIVGFVLKRRKRLIGPYYIKSLIATGGMGNVYKAKSIETGETVALKVLRDDLFIKEESKLRFKREAKMLEGLHHPGIVKTMGSGEHRGKLYIALEFIKGKTLKDIINERWPLSLEETFKIAAETASSLSYIHSKGIVHRDIKPSNIMIVGDKKRETEFGVKLMDFGIAKAIDMDTITREGSIIGTPYYIPPELIKNNRIDKRGDIFSFGVLLYELFTGEIPFYHTDPIGTIHKIINMTPQPPSNVYPYVPKCMDAIIMKCLRKNPEERYQNCDELLKDIIKCRMVIKEK